MKRIVFTVLFALLCAVGIWAQGTPLKKQPVLRDSLKAGVYKVWVNDGDYRTWYLWGVTDSTVTLGTSAYNPKENTKTIPVEKLKWVKAREKGNVAVGLALGSVLGALLGVGIGYSMDDDPPCNGVLCFSFTAAEKGKFTAILLAPLGLAAGGILGSLKTKTTINGSRATLAAEKERLKQYERWK